MQSRNHLVIRDDSYGYKKVRQAIGVYIKANIFNVPDIVLSSLHTLLCFNLPIMLSFVFYTLGKSEAPKYLQTK